ncbi:PREDICTED: vacuolar amino acid transporter 1-like [Camelina sativa]|uniref:Vacuolar amino acid transporter 1-like n=1 Tax=Camelina sativa TaxID=90675 RepID=A0ABM0VVQ2_CAMSA|nr:PREDICTED: vacuolar amino acid transporter 1-like [Camelina sativa]
MEYSDDINGDVGVSSVHACFNTLNSLSGVGILAVPYALASGGWSSFLFFFLIGATTWYTGLLLQRCLKLEPTTRSYPDIAYKAFGRKGRLLVSIFIYIELYLVATAILILEADNMSHMFPHAAIRFRGCFILDKKYLFIVVASLIVVPTVWLETHVFLSYISAGGILVSCILVMSIFWIGDIEGVGFKNKGVLVNWPGIPTSVSLYLVCYTAHPVFPTIYNSMKNKNHFPKILFISFALSSMIYGVMGIFGYLMYGEEVQSQITLNLPTHKVSAVIAISTTIVSPLTKYALIISPIMEAINTRLMKANYKRRSVRMLTGTGLVLGTILVALVVPLFGYVMSLIGALLTSFTSIVFPCAIYLKISKGYRRCMEFESVVLVVIIAMGLVLMVTGTYSAIVGIIVHL